MKTKQAVIVFGNDALDGKVDKELVIGGTVCARSKLNFFDHF